MTNRQKNYKIGYSHGRNGAPIVEVWTAFAGYTDGYNDGQSDLNDSVLDFGNEDSERCLD
jgi:hypothetical protein